MPPKSLNGIAAGEADRLQFAFTSPQTALGGSRKLRTDFPALAAQVKTFERKYQIGEDLKKVIDLVFTDKNQIGVFIDACAKTRPGNGFRLDLGPLSKERVDVVKAAVAPSSDVARVDATHQGLAISPQNSFAAFQTMIWLDPKVIIEYAHLLGR